LIGKNRRYLLVEPILVAVLTAVIYSQVSQTPLLSDKRAELFLILAAIPALLHGIYGLFCDSVEQREIINA
jgi:ABC-type phosphate transport system permease subunit